jgi:hypothetical protein
MRWQTDTKDHPVLGIDDSEIAAFFFSAKALQRADILHLRVSSVALSALRPQHPARKRHQGRFSAKIDSRILGFGRNSKCQRLFPSQ